MNSSNGSGGDKQVTTRYAPYIEAHHSDFLNITTECREATIDNSPFTDYTGLDIDTAFFGMGYVLSNFPSLYDMFGKFMAGLDIENSWNSIMQSSIFCPQANTIVEERMKIVDDKIDTETLPNFMMQMRNINAVNSSSFIIGKAAIEDNRVKERARISLDVYMELINKAEERYIAFLNWLKKVITTYAEILKGYFQHKTDVDSANYTFAVRDKLWPFEVLDYERANIAAMQGTRAIDRRMAARERSMVSKVLLVAAYTVQGAYIGAQIGGGPVGAVIGGIIGFVVGIAMIFFE